ncbi:hypothetical protein [Pontibacter pamirensis]|uniref:hypothetical protein n=1 Tax=Pontibacter pamirensis TaxID=2562824 RepID=UPI0013894006|nr:hypothetical protein [Pontibacter pamirensis]
MKTTSEKLEFYHGKLDEEAQRQLDEEIRELQRDHFRELGFEERGKGWLWINREHNLMIEGWGDFSGTFFSVIKPYYLYDRSNRTGPFDGKELASGNKMEIVAALQKLMV